MVCKRMGNIQGWVLDIDAHVWGGINFISNIIGVSFILSHPTNPLGRVRWVGRPPTTTTTKHNRSLQLSGSRFRPYFISYLQAPILHSYTTTPPYYTTDYNWIYQGSWMGIKTEGVRNPIIHNPIRLLPTTYFIIRKTPKGIILTIYCHPIVRIGLSARCGFSFCLYKGYCSSGGGWGVKLWVHSRGCHPLYSPLPSLSIKSRTATRAPVTDRQWQIEDQKNEMRTPYKEGEEERGRWWWWWPTVIELLCPSCGLQELLAS